MQRRRKQRKLDGGILCFKFMGKCKTSFRCERDLLFAKKKMMKFETTTGKVSTRGTDFQPEFRLSRHFWRLEASCLRTLAKEYRSQEEISLCCDKMCRLEAELLSFRQKIVGLERVLQDPEDKKLVLRQQISKTEERNAEIQSALKSMGQQARCVNRGDANLRASIMKFESSNRILQSQKTSQEERIAEGRAEISKGRGQINSFIRDKTESTAVLNELKRSDGRYEMENRNGLDASESRQDVSQNEIELSTEDSEMAKHSDGDHSGELNKATRFVDGAILDEMTQDGAKLYKEGRGTMRNGETNYQNCTNKLHQSTGTSTFTSEPDKDERRRNNFESLSKMGATNRQAEKADGTARYFQECRSNSDDGNDANATKSETNSLSELSGTLEVDEEVCNLTAKTFEDCCIDTTHCGAEYSGEFGGKGHVKKRLEETANSVQIIDVSRDFNKREIFEQTTHKNSFLFETRNDNSGDEIVGDFQGHKADLEAKCVICQREEDFLEEDLMKLRSKISLLESYVNQLIQEKTELLAELSRTKGNDADQSKGCHHPLYLYAPKTFIDVESVRENHIENSENEIRHQLHIFASDLETRSPVSTNEEKTYEEDLMELRANWISALENYLDKLIRDKTELLIAISEMKEDVGKADQYKFDAVNCSIAPSSFIYDRNLGEATRVGRFSSQGRNDSRDEMRKVRELVADLEAKYATCKTELQKQQALISETISREEAATRATREVVREAQLKPVLKRDVLIKTLTEDKRKLEWIIQEFAHDGRQNCDPLKAEFEKVKAPRPWLSEGTRTDESKQQEYRQTQQQILQTPNSQTTEASRSSALEQKKAFLLDERNNTSEPDYVKCGEIVDSRESIWQGKGIRENSFSQDHLYRKENFAAREQGSESVASVAIHDIPTQWHFDELKRTNENADLVRYRGGIHYYQRTFRDGCHGERTLKNTMAAEESVNQSAAEFNAKFENYQADVVVENSENSQDATETGVGASFIDSQEQISGVAVPNDSRISPVPAQDGNSAKDVITSGTFSSLSSQASNSSFVALCGNKNESAGNDLNGDTSPSSAPEENGSGVGSTNSSRLGEDASTSMRRNESLERLCDVLMEERDRATSERKEKDDEVMRLRMRSFENEQERANFKSQLAKALGRAVFAEKEMVSTKEENAELRVEIDRLKKRIEELEAENNKLKCQLGQERGNHGYAGENKAAVDVESVTLSCVDELQENPDSVAIPSLNELQENPDSVATPNLDALQENPDSVAVPSVHELQVKSNSIAVPSVGGADECKQEDEPKRAEVASTGDTKESEEALTRRERAAKRTAPNFYRHSFAGSLPRPFHSFELPRQGSHDDRHERSGSFHSDTSGESGESDIGGHLSSTLPSFMKKVDKSPFLKSGFSPVQFNYQPLPDSIMHGRRESWDMRHGSTMRASGDSFNGADSISSDEISEIDGGARHQESVERLSRDQHANELNSAQDKMYSNEENGKRADVIETETESCGITVHISSMPAPDFKDSISEFTAGEPHESYANVPVHGDTNVPTNNQSLELAEEEEKRETVSELVNIWNSKTTEVDDI